MKTKQLTQKLMLKKETIVNLNAVTMKNIHGGIMPATHTCFITINYDCTELYEDIQDTGDTGSNLC